MTEGTEQPVHLHSVQASLASALGRAETADRLLAETQGEVQHLQEQVGQLMMQAKEEERQRAAQAVQLEDVQQLLKVFMLPLLW